jgi:hypothetical protein
MKDLLNLVNPRPSTAPVTVTNSNAAQVGAIIDKKGYESVTYIIQAGALGAGTSVAASIEHGDDPALADTSVPTADLLVGTTALASFIAATGANKCYKLGYIGPKRYTRLTLTPAGNGAASVVLAATAVLGHPHQAPADNPPS